MFETETFEVILARMLAKFPDTLDKRQGSVIYDLLAPKAAELAQAYAQMDNVLNLGFASTTTGELLERRVAEQGITRKPAVQAEGNVVLTGPVDTVVPQGTRLATDESELYFTTQSDVTLTNGTATVLAVAEVGGTSGNVGIGLITMVIGDLVGIVSVTNAEPFSGGLDAETDEELYERYMEKVQSPVTSGNKYQYIMWAKSVPGISDAKVYPLWDGPGTVKVVVINSEKRTPSDSALEDVATYIDEQKPLLAEVTVEGVVEVPINVSVTLTLRAGTNLETARLSIMLQIATYLKSIAFDYDIVRYTSVGNAILDGEGVIDYANLTINGTSGNIILGATEVPVIGSVNVITT